MPATRKSKEPKPCSFKQAIKAAREGAVQQQSELAREFLDREDFGKVAAILTSEMRGVRRGSSILPAWQDLPPLP